MCRGLVLYIRGLVLTEGWLVDFDQNLSKLIIVRNKINILKSMNPSTPAVNVASRW